MTARDPRRWLWGFATLLACGGGGGGDDGDAATPDMNFFEPQDVGPDGPAAPPPDEGTPPPDAGEAPPPCGADTDCEALAYCREGTCTAGCRVEPDNCRSTPAGLPQTCDPDARTCSPGPEVETGCEDDAECAAGRYCGAEGRCLAGCRAQGADCGPFDRCDAATHTCQASPCAADAECPEGTFCDADAGGCAPGCRAETCPAGQHCDASHQCRAACAGDDDCTGQDYCDADLGSCRVPCAMPGHAGCLAEEVCDPASHRCAPGCRDDAGELGAGNDTPESAAALPVAADANRPGVYSGSAAGRFLCPGDPDWFQVSFPEPSRAEVTVSWDTTPGDLTLTVTDTAGTPLAQATGTSPLSVRTSALGVAPAAAELLVGLSGAQLAGPAGYALNVRTAASETGCFPDASDPLDDRPAGGRAAGQRPEDRFVERFTGNACRGDTDWICFDMEANDGLLATLVTPPSCAPLDLALHAQRAAAADPGVEPVAAAVPLEGGPGVRLEVTPESGLLANERYCLSVAAPEAAADTQCEDWALTLEIIRSGVRCADPAEPNGTLGEARPLDAEGPLAGPDGRLPLAVPLEHPEALRLCPGDVDLFRLQADAGDILRAWIEGEAELGVAEVALLDPTGRQRGDEGAVTPPGAAAPLAALAVVQAPGPWYVRVRGDAVGGGAYRLFVRRDRPGAGCGADFQEPVARNDAPPDAALLVGPRDDRWSVTNGRLCSPQAGATDEDWYRFEIPAPGHRLCVDTTFVQREGNIDLELYRADEAGEGCRESADCETGQCIAGRCAPAVGAARTQHDGEMLSFGTGETEAGDYFLRVFSADMEENAYDLAVTLVPPAPACGPDFRERDRANDAPEQATPLGAGRAHVCDAWICHDERQVGDWYSIFVPPGEDRTVHLGFDGLSDGTLALTLLDPANPDAGEVFVAEANTLAQCLNVRGGPEGAELRVGVTAVRVSDDGDARVDYTLQVAPTNLGREARGACEALSGGLYGHIPWPIYVLGL